MDPNRPAPRKAVLARNWMMVILLLFFVGPFVLAGVVLLVQHLNAN